MSLKEVLKKIVPQTLIVKRNQKRTMLEIQKHKTMSLEEKKSLIAEAYKNPQVILCIGIVQKDIQKN